MSSASDFVVPSTISIQSLDCEEAFNALTEKEKLYAHYISRASWYGSMITFVQVSLESPLIYTLLNKLVSAEPIADLKKKALSDCGFEEAEFTALLLYICGVFDYKGNYKSFGDSKIVPDLPKEKFVKLVLASKAAALQSDDIQNLLNNCVDKIYSLEDNEKHLGYPEIGVTTYLSKNFTKEDNKFITEFLKQQKLEAYNSRVFKTENPSGNCSYEIRLASVLSNEDNEDHELLGSYTVDGHQIAVTRGDYSKLLKLVNQCLLEAKKYAANEYEVQMLDKYIQSFRTGSIDAHKDGSRHWIKNKGPLIETYIGFIEVYKDPAGVRGEFEGFTAMVNKLTSLKFAELVKNAEKLLTLLPWPSTYEKDTFLQPDFTSLDVLNFSSSLVPRGINIPNYDDIRQNEGFKNVVLGNAITANSKQSGSNYLSPEDQELFKKHLVPTIEIKVGLHELLGHGSGKLFRKKSMGTFNFDVEKVIDLETNEKISSWYEEGETFDSIFSAFGSSFEECRADTVAMYLATVPDVYRIFGQEDTAIEKIYVSYLMMCHHGLESLQMYEPQTDSWLQAHSQGNFALLNVLLEAGNSLITIKETTGEDGHPDLLLTMDGSKIISAGKPAIGKFLEKLQLYKSTANIVKAKELFKKYTSVTDEGQYPFLQYRKIVMARKKPRPLFIQANTVIDDEKVLLKTYDLTPEGMIQSFIDRFKDNELDGILKELWQKDKAHFA